MKERSKNPRNRLAPYKLLAMLLYGTYQCVNRSGPSGTLRTGDMAKLLRVPNSRVKEFMEFLLERGFLSELAITHGYMSFTLVSPGI